MASYIAIPGRNSSSGYDVDAPLIESICFYNFVQEWNPINREEIEKQIEELKNIAEKFKELKSLVYEYKEKKENEINHLNEEQKKLKNQLDDNKLDYEKVIEKATDQIENFITKIDSENPLQ